LALAALPAQQAAHQTAALETIAFFQQLHQPAAAVAAVLALPVALLEAVALAAVAALTTQRLETATRQAHLHPKEIMEALEAALRDLMAVGVAAQTPQAPLLVLLWGVMVEQEQPLAFPAVL